MEKWKWVTGYENLYMVSDEGNVKGIKSGKVLSNKRVDGSGYIQVALRKDGKAKELRVNRLVAQEFLPKPDNENKITVNHKDGNKTNNAVDNLEWSTLSEQMKHAYANGLKKPAKGCKVLTEEQMKEIKATYQRYKKGFGSVALAKKYGVESTTILRVINGHWD
ncbi:HNH endonuclease [Bacillus cereus]|uniref:NUMOD4 domain-containing protein n=1 Tax=Bacillus anthracis TaxID=1392 RepID=UPI00207985D6|nr:NUMOD4 domain-containing protein [Bacillus anthracis]MCU5058913.1 HNH endonuclease [Bacillus cereus]USL05432.1 HNH endonuclease [Bacillus anthracis]